MPNERKVPRGRGEKKNPRLEIGTRSRNRATYFLASSGARVTSPVIETANSASALDAGNSDATYLAVDAVPVDTRGSGKIPAVVNGRYRRHMRPSRSATCVENSQRAEGEKFDICPQRGRDNARVAYCVAPDKCDARVTSL